jgi:AcrR family transcriptional regulator
MNNVQTGIGMKRMERAERKEREYNLRRTEILVNAERVFAAKGFHKATVAGIADASGFAVGTLYQFFESKEQLFAAMITEKLALLYGGIRNAVAEEKDTIAKIRALVGAHFDFIEKNVNFCTIFVQRESTFLAEASAALRERMIADYLEHIAFIETIMSEGVTAGILKGNHPRLMAYALAGMLRSFTFYWLNKQGGSSLQEITETLLDIYLEGVKASAS